VARPHRFGGDLTVKIDLKAVIDSKDLVVLCDDEWIIGIVAGVDGAGRVAVDEVIKSF